MARAKFHPREVDPNFQIEDAVRTTLGTNATAEVAVKVIESNYDLLDDNLEPITGTTADKCRAIAKIVGADYSLRDDNVVFRNA